MNTRIYIAILALGVTTQTFAQELIGVGDPLPVLNLKDQNDTPHQIPNNTRRVLLTVDNGGTALATELIESHDKGWLTDKKQVFLADIHKMPSLVTRLFAMPQLREKPYPIMLGREASELQMFPRRKNCVTVIQVKDGKVSDLAFACNREELKAANGS